MKNIFALLFFAFISIMSSAQENKPSGNEQNKDKSGKDGNQDKQDIKYTEGASGVRRSIHYKFSIIRSDSDPGTGIFRYDNDNVSKVNWIYVDNNDLSGDDQTNWYSTWDKNTGATARGSVSVVEYEGKNVIDFDFTDVFTDGSGYWKFPVKYVSGEMPADGAVYYYVFNRIDHNKEQADKENQGNNTEHENQGNDTDHENQGNNTEHENQGNDTDHENQGNNTAQVNQGNNTEHENQGNDTAQVNQGNNTEHENQGNNTDHENQGNDTEHENQGNNTDQENNAVQIVTVTQESQPIQEPQPVQVTPPTPEPQPVQVTPPTPEPQPVQVTPPTPEPQPVQVTPPTPEPQPVQVTPPTPEPQPVQVTPPTPEPQPVQVTPPTPEPQPVQVTPPTPEPQPVQVTPPTPEPQPAQVEPAVKEQPPVEDTQLIQKPKPARTTQTTTAKQTTQPTQTNQPATPAQIPQPSPAPAQQTTQVTQPAKPAPERQTTPSTPPTQPAQTTQATQPAQTKPEINVTNTSPTTQTGQYSNIPASNQYNSNTLPNQSNIYEKYLQDGGRSRGKCYSGIIEIGYALGVGNYGINNFRFNFINGFKIGKVSSIGLGIGYRRYFDENETYTDRKLVSGNQMPVFLDLRTNFSTRKVTPYLAIGLGGSAGLDTSESKQMGLYFCPSGGIWFNLSNRLAIFGGVAYELQKLEYVLISDDSHIKKNTSSISLNIGISF